MVLQFSEAIFGAPRLSLRAGVAMWGLAVTLHTASSGHLLLCTFVANELLGGSGALFNASVVLFDPEGEALCGAHTVVSVWVDVGNYTAGGPLWVVAESAFDLVTCQYLPFLVSRYIACFVRRVETLRNARPCSLR